MSSIRSFLIAAAIIICLAITAAFAASGPPLAGTWNIQASGRATSSGDLLFRVTPGDGGDPVEVSVSVLLGANELAVARDIRRTLASQLRSDRFDVELGQGANVLVMDEGRKPNFSLELVDSDVENLRVAVQSAAPAASPTVPAQAVPATAPTAPTPAAPGDVVPPTTAPAPNASQPAAPPPANAPPMPNPAPPPNATGGAGQPASAPVPSATPSGPASAPPPSATPSGPAGAPPPG